MTRENQGNPIHMQFTHWQTIAAAGYTEVLLLPSASRFTLASSLQAKIEKVEEHPQEGKEAFLFWAHCVIAPRLWRMDDRNWKEIQQNESYPKLKYKFNVFPKKILTIYFVDTENLILKYMGKQRPYNEKKKPVA